MKEVTWTSNVSATYGFKVACEIPETKVWRAGARARVDTPGILARAGLGGAPGAVRGAGAPSGPKVGSGYVAVTTRTPRMLTV